MTTESTTVSNIKVDGGDSKESEGSETHKFINDAEDVRLEDQQRRRLLSFSLNGHNQAVESAPS